MKVRDLMNVLKTLPPDAHVNANNNASPDEFGVLCVSYNPRLRVVLLEADDSLVNHVDRVLWNESERFYGTEAEMMANVRDWQNH
jgi:hypothetical protein